MSTGDDDNGDASGLRMFSMNWSTDIFSEVLLGMHEGRGRSRSGLGCACLCVMVLLGLAIDAECECVLDDGGAALGSGKGGAGWCCVTMGGVVVRTAQGCLLWVFVCVYVR